MGEGVREDEVKGANYSPESITPDVNEEIIYLCISTKLFTLSLLCVFVCSCAFRLLIVEGGGDQPAREKVCRQIKQQAIYIFHQRCLFLIS